MNYRFADLADTPLLAELNVQLMEDAGHWVRLSKSQLEERIRGWLEREYRAVLFERDGEVIAYALYRPDEWGGICVRQFFVNRKHRRHGIGRLAFRMLRGRVWPSDCRITAEVFVGNRGAQQFWKALGFEEYAITMQRRTSKSANAT